MATAAGTATGGTGYTQSSLGSDSAGEATAAERRNLHEGKKSVAAP